MGAERENKRLAPAVVVSMARLSPRAQMMPGVQGVGLRPGCTPVVSVAPRLLLKDERDKIINHLLEVQQSMFPTILKLCSGSPSATQFRAKR